MCSQETILVCPPLIDCSLSYDSDQMSIRYYVQMGATPPKVFFKHPIDMVPANRSAPPYAPVNNTQMPQPQLVVPPVQTPRDPSQSDGNTGKLTFAQQLYASSMSSSLSPMINSQSVPTSQLPPIHIRNLPTPPPSSSPPPGTHPSVNFNSIPSTAPPFLNPHLTITRTPTPSNNSCPQRHRSSSTSQRSVYVNPSTASSRPTRHLVTMARPPDEQSSSVLSPLVLEPPAAIHSAPIPSPPPASSILFSQTPVTLPITPPLTAVQSTPVTPPNISSPFSVPSGTAYKLSPLGRVAGIGCLADGIVSTLQSVLLTPGTGVDQMSLQAVIQGRPDADYQRITNALIKLHQQQHQQFALMKLQMRQPPSPGIDYNALVAEVQKVQAQQITTAQQQQQQQHALQSLHWQGRLQQPLTDAQQYQALIEQQYQQQQQQQQTAQHQALLRQQKGTQSANQPYLEAYKIYSAGDNGGDGLFDSHSGGNWGQDFSGDFNFLSLSFNQDNSGGFGVDISRQSN